MTDDAHTQRRRRRRPPEEPAPAAHSDGAPDSDYEPVGALNPDDPMAALERLQSLTTSTSSPPPPTTLQPPRAAQPPARAPRPRTAAASVDGRRVARIAAPVVFLVAVIALVSIVVQSGVLSGKSEPVVNPTPAATKTKSGGSATGTTKMYTVKTGDTLSGIAAKFDTTTSEILDLNPDSTSTLVVGTKIRVPKL